MLFFHKNRVDHNANIVYKAERRYVAKAYISEHWLFIQQIPSNKKTKLHKQKQNENKQTLCTATIKQQNTDQTKTKQNKTKKWKEKKENNVFNSFNWHMFNQKL